MNSTDRLVDAGLDAELASLIGTPEQLIRFAKDGRVPKAVLASALTPEKRRMFLDTCAGIERELTEKCTAKQDPCLESGCALEGEVCLEAVLRAGDGYCKACAASWLAVFADPNNRLEAWRT
jgi:hypothetical protein